MGFNKLKNLLNNMADKVIVGLSKSNNNYITLNEIEKAKFLDAQIYLVIELWKQNLKNFRSKFTKRIFKLIWWISNKSNNKNKRLNQLLIALWYLIKMEFALMIYLIFFTTNFLISFNSKCLILKTFFLF